MLKNKKFTLIITGIMIMASTATHTVLSKPDTHISLSPKTTLTIECGDITRQKVDAIVNAANQQLQNGGGVCGAIFNAAGSEDLQKACDEHQPVSDAVRCPTGEARITPAFKLSTQGITHIIHAVGPDCRVIKKREEQNDLLYKAYYNSLALADAHKISSIAFPFISSSIYAFPKERAAQVAVDAMREYALKNPSTQLREIRMVLFDKSDAPFFIDANNKNNAQAKKVATIGSTAKAGLAFCLLGCIAYILAI